MERVVLRLPSRLISVSQGWTLDKWLVQPGDSLYKEQRVARFTSVTSGAIEHVVAPKSGTFVKLHVRAGNVIDTSDVPLGEIEFCPHSVVFNGVCALCGDEEQQHFSKAPQEQSRLPVAYSASLSVTQTEAESVGSVAARRLFESKQLSLVLDLDHTLVHATDDPRATPMLKHSPENVDLSSVSSFSLPSSRGGNRYPDVMHLKLRPNLARFLEKVAVKFNLHIYTMGSRLYADRVARLIDPDNRFFGGRITSREDFPEGKCNQKNIERLFPCDDSMVLIVDDREDVWLSNANQSYMPNLIRAQPYHFWVGMHEAYDRVSSAADPAPAPAPVSRVSRPPRVPNSSAHANGKGGSHKPNNREQDAKHVGSGLDFKDGYVGNGNEEPGSDSPGIASENPRGNGSEKPNSDSQEVASANLRKYYEKLSMATTSQETGATDATACSRSEETTRLAEDTNVNDDKASAAALRTTENDFKGQGTYGSAVRANMQDTESCTVRMNEAESVGSVTAPETNGSPAHETESKENQPLHNVSAQDSEPGRKPTESTTSTKLRNIVKGWWDADSSPKSKNHLLRLAQVLEDCHTDFFRRCKMTSVRRILENKPKGKKFQSPVDVKDVLADLRKKVLAGCVLTFSGLKQKGEAPETVAEWNLALRLGAICSMDFVNGRTTHVITPTDRPPNTQKCLEAMQYGTAFVVTSNWVEDTALNFERQHELTYCESARRRFANGEEFRVFVEKRYDEATRAMKKRSREELDEISSKEVVGVTPPFKKRRLEPEVAPLNSLQSAEDGTSAVRVLSHDDIEEAMDDLFDE